MELTHVCRWENHEWKSISIHEATKIYKRSVSANSGIFICSLCGKKVTLAYGDIKAPHFRHNSGDDDKNCPERTLSVGGIVTHTQRNILPLPIRINMNGRALSFEVGLIPPPEYLIKKNINKRFTIYNSYNQKNYTYLIERIRNSGITYFSVGNFVGPTLKLGLENVSPELRKLWPISVIGFTESLILFDRNSRKKLPLYADVTVNHEYIALSRKRISCFYVDLTLLQENHSLAYPYLYFLKITKYDRKVANFFLENHYRLTDKPASLTPLWPPFVCNPYIAYYQSPNVFIFMRGNSVTAEYYPDVRKDRLRMDGGEIVRLSPLTITPQQLVSIGRSSTLRFLYLWQQDLNMTAKEPVVEICDAKGELIDKDVLRKKTDLTITSEVDVIIRIYKKDQLKDEVFLKAKEKIIQTIDYYETLKIIAGVDIIRCLSCDRKSQNKILGTDEEILRKLQSIKTSHTVSIKLAGSVLEKLYQYPKTRAWIANQIKKNRFSKQHALAVHQFIERGQL